MIDRMSAQTRESGYESIVVEAGTLESIANCRPVSLLGKRYVFAFDELDTYEDDGDYDEEDCSSFDEGYMFDAYKDACLEQGIDWRRGL